MPPPARARFTANENPMNVRRLLPAVLLLFSIAGSIAVAGDDVIIEALVDGPSALHIRQGAIYWVNGGNAKPGRADLRNEPTYVNGAAWNPRWKNMKNDRGADKSLPFQ